MLLIAPAFCSAVALLAFGHLEPMAAIGGAVAGLLFAHQLLVRGPESPATPGPDRPLVTALVIAWLAIQIALPLRHFFIGGHVSWSEDGHRFAWHMKMRSKRAECAFVVRDRETGELRELDLDEWLTPRQGRKLCGNPGMLRMFARQVRAKIHADTGRDVAVHARARASLNGRPPAELVDPKADLATVPFTPGAYPWVRPFEPERYPLP